MRAGLLSGLEARDYLVRARPEAYELDFEALAAALTELLDEIGE
jgi:RNase P protein component